MKLLIITQKVDFDDGVLGFFHGWLEKMAAVFEKMNVICLQKGESALPDNVQIFSLGKEELIEASKPSSRTSRPAEAFDVAQVGSPTGRRGWLRGLTRIKFIIKFYYLIFKLRNEYDGIFVHMNPEYVVLGGWFWRLMGKKIVLWYNHRHGSLISLLAYFLATYVLYTSPFSFFAGYGKAQQMPAGVDTDLFKADPTFKKNTRSILYLGRIAPVKNADVLVEAAKLLNREGEDFILNIVGNTAAKDGAYFKKIKLLTKDLESIGRIKFFGEMPNCETPKIYNQNEIFVNLTNSGSLDKTILEAMACEIVAIVSNQAFKDILSPQFIFKENNVRDLKEKLSAALNLSIDKKQELSKRFREYVVDNHSLALLIKKLQTMYEVSL